MGKIEIKEVLKFEEGLIAPINILLDQLVSTPIVFTEQIFRNIVDSQSSHLFLIYVEKKVAGMLTLGTYVSPTGVKYWVEDVVVDRNYRGMSLGKKLIEHAISYVSSQGKSTLMLTSKPARIAANRLYQTVGFQSKQTNVYKMDLNAGTKCKDEDLINNKKDGRNSSEAC